jgi:outer membrane lipoprotein-sorting protein
MIPNRGMLLCGGTLLLAATAAPPTRADDASAALLKQVATATKALKTLTADLEMSQDAGGNPMKMQGSVQLKRPNLAKITVSIGGNNAQMVDSDGKNLYIVFGNQYMKSSPGVNGERIQAMGAFQIPMFFNPSLTFLPNAATKYLGKETLDGKEYQVIGVTSPAAKGMDVKLYISDAKLVERVSLDVNSGGARVHIGTAFKNIKTDAALADTAFAYTPPKTVTLYQPDSNNQPDYAAKLVPVGKPAPMFTLLRPEGGTISLEKTLKEKKAVLVNFWFYG